MTSINGHDPIGGILKLQLKKPEHWKWELSTSKSSPHIALPLVQLFDQNGELLIETDNKNSGCRRSWHCDDLKNTSPTEILINFYKSKLPKELWKSSIKDLKNGCKKSNTVDFASLQKPKVQKQPSMIPVDENKTINFEKKNEEFDFPRKKYKLRTCNAGTLVVSDDSFEIKPRIRRLKKHEDLQNGAESTADLETNHTSTNGGIGKSKQSVRNIEKKIKAKGHKHSKSDLGVYSSEYKPFNNVMSRHTSDSNLKEIGQKGGDTQIVQIMDLYDEERRSNKPKLCIDNNKIKDKNVDGNKKEVTRNYNECGYFVQEPITPGSDGRRPSFPIVSPSRRTRRRNHIMIRRTSEDTSSSGALPLDATRKRKLKRRKKRKGDRVLEIDRQPVVGVEDATQTLQNAPDAILLRLVRRLASVNHDGVVSAPVANAPLTTTRCSSGPSRPCDLDASRLCQVEAEMGANVSRHSGKGLSGRRTQSSGNICNGKTTNVAKFLGPCAARSNSGVKERKRFCGSLPNHLDGGDDDSYDYDTESVCYVKENNNHVDVVQQAVKVPPQVPPKPASRFPSSAGHYKKVEPDLVDVELKLQPFGVGPVGGHPTSDAALLCDQGYGSERSPEDENPPPLPMMPAPSSESGADDDSDPSSKYSFITPEATFTVSLTKGLRGLGLSVCGGRDSDSSLPGLVRIKRLFPNQPAAQCGLLAPGDVLLAANGQPLTGLTNYEALEVLRTTPNNVVLTICRPPSDVLSAVSPLSEVPPPPPRRDPPCTLNLLPPLAPLEEPYCGEFDIILTKVQGSLGFTLRKEDESALGHYVRALVREPALSDGRIKPGDKIVAVNDVELSSFSHEQAVQFLRQCGNEVKLRLYRDAAQTPVAALSPTEPDPPQRLRLRQEAMDMLSDLAVRKLSPNGGPPGDIGWGTSGARRSISPPVGSPRRLRRTQRSTPDTDCGSTCTDDLGSSNKYVLSSQVTSESDSFSRKASIGSENTSTPNFSSIESDSEKPIRPNFLNLCSPAATPTSRKPKFQFSIAHNAYELNNLDADILDAPNLTYTLNRNDKANENDYHDSNNAMMSEEPASMPPISSAGFSYKNPAYQSAHPQCGSDNVDSNIDKKSSGNEEGTKGLLKWKGVVFTPEGSVDENATDKKPKDNSINTSCDSEIEILNVELNRGWNSRLGFSLQQGEGNTTFISAVHADSVAAKDGRLKAGDRLLRVNDEDIDGMSTNSVIDLLRIVRGPISIIVARKK